MYFNQSSSRINSINNRNLRPEYQIFANDEICGDYCHNFGRPYYKQHDSQKIAALKIFAFLILQRWRKTKNELKDLNQSLKHLRKSNTCTENQLCVYKNLIRMEQNRNDDLIAQLKRTLNNMKRKMESCRTFSKTISNLKKSHTLLEQELDTKYKENDGLHEVLAQTNRKLIQSRMEQISLQTQLKQNQRFVQSLEGEKNVLVTELSKLNQKHREMERNLMKQMKDKNTQIVEAEEFLIRSQTSTFINVRHVNDEIKKSFETGKHELSFSQLQATNLQNNLNNSIGQRFRMCWSRFMEYPKYTLNYAHLLSYYLLPAMPSPLPKFT